MLRARVPLRVIPFAPEVLPIVRVPVPAVTVIALVNVPCEAWSVTLSLPPELPSVIVPVPPAVSAPETAPRATVPLLIRSPPEKVFATFPNESVPAPFLSMEKPVPLTNPFRARVPADPASTVVFCRSASARLIVWFTPLLFVIFPPRLMALPASVNWPAPVKVMPLNCVFAAMSLVVDGRVVPPKKSTSFATGTGVPVPQLLALPQLAFELLPPV